MSDQNDKQKDFLISFHKALTTDLHEAQRNFISLIVAVIAGMGVFGVGLKAFLDTPCSQNTIYFTVTSAGAVILLLIVYFAANISSYTYRKYQIILHRIEENIPAQKVIIPDSWNPCKKDMDPPEIFKFFKVLAGFMIGGILLIYGCILFIYSIEIRHYIFVIAGLFILLLTVCLNARFRWSYAKKICIKWVEDSYVKKLENSCNENEAEKIKELYEKMKKSCKEGKISDEVIKECCEELKKFCEEMMKSEKTKTWDKEKKSE